MDEETATEAQDAQTQVEAQDAGKTESPARGDPLGFLIDIPLRLTVELGSTRVLLREVLQLNKGSVVELDRHSSDAVDILVNGRKLARGEVTVVDERLAVRVVEVMGIDEAMEGSR
jgi:flagellar motor switch protein FliN/FliY